MSISQKLFNLSTTESIGFYNITEKVQKFVETTSVKNGQALIFSRHTTTALIINEDETRLLEDIRTYLKKLAPPTDSYLHNDLHLRDVPPDEPENAHSHLMAMTLSTHEIIPIMDGKLALGTYQSLMLVELDGPRERTFFVQVSGEK